MQPTSPHALIGDHGIGWKETGLWWPAIGNGDEFALARASAGFPSEDLLHHSHPAPDRGLLLDIRNAEIDGGELGRSGPGAGQDGGDRHRDPPAGDRVLHG